MTIERFGVHRCSYGPCTNEGRYYDIINATWFCGICDAKTTNPSIRGADLATFMVWANIAATAKTSDGRMTALDEMRALLTKRGVTFV